MRSINEIKKIVEDSMDISFESKKFVKIEILFRLCERIGITNNVNKFYMLLSKSDIIYEKEFTNDNYLLMNAKILLKTLAHAKVYQDTLKEYSLKGNLKYCFYIIENNCLKRNPKIPELYEDRLYDYDILLDTREISVVKDKKKTKSTDIYIVKTASERDTYIKFETLNIKDTENKICSKKDEKIFVSIKDIMKAADKIDKVEKTKYRRRILENNIYNTSKGKKEKTEEFVMNGVINMVGQVGAGKSTFADALGVELMDSSYRIVMILPTVDLVLKKAELFKKMGYKTCTLIGNYGRNEHIDNQMRGNHFLTEYISAELQQPCMLNFLIHEPDVVIKYGQEPCVKLKKLNDKNPKRTYICQYYDFCPRTQNDRNIENADIVVTTLEGFCLCNFGKNRKNFLQYAIENFDLVVMDEVDSIVCALDSIFAPNIPINEYLKSTLNYRMEYKKSSLNDKLQRDRNEQEFIHKLDELEHLMIDISDDVKKNNTDWSKNDLKDFSAISLLNKLKLDTQDEIPQDIWNVFYNLSKLQNTDREIELLNSVENRRVSTSYMIDKISEIISNGNIKKKQIAKKRCEELNHKIWKKFLFILKVITFEQLYKTLSNLIEDMNDVSVELRKILNFNLKEQQKLMPNAPIGNMLSIEIKDNEMYIKKQFALGRTLALKLPYLILDKEGNPKGANVLLMSGTGYMPGSDRYHISDKVDYIIEAEEEKREYITQTKVRNIRSNIRVSGANPKDKDKNLRILIEEIENNIMKCISRDEKILMIVNDYNQCKVAFKSVEKILNKNKSDYEVFYLKSDKGEFEGIEKGNEIQRRDITKFKKEILIAPACVIERGYNIVDYLGNSWFDTVMFLVRPMSNPNDYNIHVQRVNGYIMNRFTQLSYTDRISVMDQIRKDAFHRYIRLEIVKGGLADLTEDMQVDAIASLFVVIEQVFGRLCRLGSTLKKKYPTIYWVDGAFNAIGESKFDTLKELEKYLNYLMKKSKNPIVAETLYKPFYKALKGEKS